MSSENRERPARRWARPSAAFLLGIVAAFGILYLSGSNTREWQTEKSAFLKLLTYEREMLAAGGKGVATSPQGAYIDSFERFLEYVRSRDASTVAPWADADNPFPGLLRGKHYVRTAHPADSEAPLLAGERSFYREVPERSFRYRLHAGGYISDEPRHESDAVPSTATSRASANSPP